MLLNSFNNLPPIRRAFFSSAYREFLAQRKIQRDWPIKSAEALRSEAGETGLFVSLTSHTPRFGTLAPTLKSLLMQDVRPEAVLLWIGHACIPNLPADVRELEAFGLRIIAAEDFGPHTKYHHALEQFPNARIAICDDDTYYPPNWLSDLISGDRAGEIPCRRIHRIAYGENGAPKGYRTWHHDVNIRDASPQNFPTGTGGVLLRRDRLAPDVLDITLARRLCPTADDIWLYAMGRLVDTRFRLVGGYEPLVVWNTSQNAALWRQNVLDNGNDGQMAAVFAHYGIERLRPDLAMEFAE